MNWYKKASLLGITRDQVNAIGVNSLEDIVELIRIMQEACDYDIFYDAVADESLDEESFREALRQAIDDAKKNTGHGNIVSGPVCAGSAFEVSGQLEELGYSNRLVCGKFIEEGIDKGPHCWVELNDGRIVDTTVDQFGEKWPRYLIGTYEEYPEYRPERYED
jgi:hypothetical protein